MTRNLLMFAAALTALSALSGTEPWRDVFAADLSNADYDPAIWHRDAEGCLTAEKDVAIWTKADYGRFELVCEYNLEPAANSGVLLYCSNTKSWIPNAVEIQLLDDAAPKWKGLNPRQANLSFFGHQAPTSNPAKPAGEWNQLTVVADGPKIAVSLNGVQVNACDLSVWTDAKKLPDGSPIPPWLSRPWSDLAHIGKIGFQGRHAGAGVRFRNVKIRPLPAAKPRTALTLMSYNIRIGCGHDDPFKLPKGSLGHLPQCAAVINAVDADFIGLQEVDRCSARVGGMDQTAELARLCGRQGVWVEKIPNYGVSLLARDMPFCVEKVLMKGSLHTRVLLVAEFPDCFVANTHFPLADWACTAAAAAVRQALAPKAAKKPVFLMGDFNSTPTSAAIKALKEDFAVLSDETKFTWNAKAPDRTIDYIFVDKAHAEDYRAVSRKVEAHPEATDHCALSVSLEKCR